MPDSKSITTPEVEVHYLEFGSPTGTPVFLLHGFPDSPAAWLDVVDHLDVANLRLVVPWLRGFGQTRVLKDDLIGGQEAALAHDLLAFADALHLPKFHIVGHDWGARTSYGACVLAPERVLSNLALATPYVMYGGKDYQPDQINGNWYQWYFQLELGRKALTADAEAFCHQLWRSWSPEWKFSSKDFSTAAESWKNPQFVDIVLHYYRTRWGGALSLRAYAELQDRLSIKPPPKIATPTIYVQGSADNCDLPACSEDQASYFSGPYERVLLKGLGHFPHREDPKAIAKLVARSLKSSTN